ncbi:MAG: DNA repair protein RecN [Gammaproteobacteria bacterium TMED1]|nr:MAG: DNA repair protein RecN [Gammaproteobacteria bacterium TMED1]|tara:strand:- start:6264 stop:7916 length:1653 start_codon:yes stop_codon:yes gene_type:complete
MLLNLNIQNFALANDLDIEFENKMSVVTGETGAGKSIMLDALSLSLGNRADTKMITAGADRAEINATFDISSNESVKQWMIEHDLEDNSTCILRRIITIEGRSKGFINGVPSTLSDMSYLGNLLVDLHSQHEHQSLLVRDNQRRLLDEFGGHQSLVKEIGIIYQLCQSQEKKLKNLLSNLGKESSKLQLLEYQLDELQALDLKEDEVALLETEQKRLSSSEDILRNCNDAINLCRSNDTNNIVGMLARVIELLSVIDDPKVRGVAELLNSSQIQVEEASDDLQSMIGNIIVDPERLSMVEKKLSSIYDIARKHHVKANHLLTVTKDIEKEIASLKNIDTEVDMLEAQLSQCRKKYQEVASKLTEKRTRHGLALQSAVTEKLRQLGMTEANFEVSLKTKPADSVYTNGVEDVEFLITTNKKYAARSLNRIASGGELSRISLAIQVVTANTSRIPTLVFDEVDVGIGGATAEVVGALLRDLGTKTQIICVTHLAQVAAKGNQHLRVNKQEDGIQVTPLNRSRRVKELARMLGGIELTEQSIAHAEQILGNAH